MGVRGGGGSKGNSVIPAEAARPLICLPSCLFPLVAGESPWPPVAPGWVYFPSCDSSGFTRTEAQHNLTRHRDLQSLLAAARNDPLVKAVTTAGETKMKLGPQVKGRVCVSREGLEPGQPSALSRLCN
jgi:hypothetical protein